VIKKPQKRGDQSPLPGCENTTTMGCNARKTNKKEHTVFIIINGTILVIFMYIITRLASKEIFSTSNKINREVGRAKDFSAPLYCGTTH
jgi:cell division protein FtsI/penicillin-binding protein 2